MLDTMGSLAASISADYAFPNSIYLHGSMLYNSGGLSSLPSGGSLFIGSAFQSAKSLMPTKYSYLAQVSGSINPLTRADLAMIYGAGLNIIFVMPSISYSIRENWDLSLVGQIFFGELNQNVSNLGNYIFLRLKWSY